MNEEENPYWNSRYVALYQRLFFLYVEKDVNPDWAGEAASIAFQWLTGWTWEDWFKAHLACKKDVLPEQKSPNRGD